MRSKSGLVLSTVLVVLTLLAGEAHAREGRIPLHRIPGGGPPFQITNPGHYILTRNITISSGSAIIVNSDCVELDLNGKSIKFTGTTPGPGDHLIQIASGRTDVTIYNGWLTGGFRGIDYQLVGAGLGLRARIRDVQIRGALDRGISIDRALNIELVSNQVHDIAGPFGIGVFGGDPFAGRIVENTVGDVAQTGIFLDGLEGGDVIRNIVRRSGAGATSIELGGNPAFVGGNVIRENTISSGGIGLWVGSRNNQVEDNVIYGNASWGLILLSDGNKIRNNTIAKNGGDGIHLLVPAAFRNVIEGNHIEGNAGAGIDFGAGSSSLCRDNIVQLNVGGASIGGSGQIDLGGNEPLGLCL